MATTATTVTAREAEQIAAANASGRQPVVFVHGLWLLHSSWDAWRTRFEAEGYATVAVDWPGDQATVADAHRNAGSLAGTSVADVADHDAEVVAGLTRTPIVILMRYQAARDVTKVKPPTAATPLSCATSWVAPPP